MGSINKENKKWNLGGIDDYVDCRIYYSLCFWKYNIGVGDGEMGDIFFLFFRFGIIIKSLFIFS